VKFLGLIYILCLCLGLGLDYDNSRLKEEVVKIFGFVRWVCEGFVQKAQCGNAISVLFIVDPATLLTKMNRDRKEKFWKRNK
jgi:hypothetical protein